MRHHPTVRSFLAGGVPEVMLHLRNLGLLKLDALTASGESLGKMLDWWQASTRRTRLRQLLQERDGVDPNAKRGDVGDDHGCSETFAVRAR